jgi:hypothetical protein
MITARCPSADFHFSLSHKFKYVSKITKITGLIEFQNHDPSGASSTFAYSRNNFSRQTFLQASPSIVLMTLHTISKHALGPIRRSFHRFDRPILLFNDVVRATRTFRVSTKARETLFDPAGIERESDEVDVCIVGGGPAGLSAAIRLKQLAQKDGREIRVLLLEKGSEIGNPIPTIKESSNNC